MRQKLVSIGDDYWIEDDEGQRVYKINGKAMRVRDTLILEDPDGTSCSRSRRRSSASATPWRSRTAAATRWRRSRRH